VTNLLSMTGRELQWSRPHLSKRIYELRAGDTLVAELSFAKQLGWTATASAGGQSREFTRTGLFRSTITVRDSTTGEEVASISDNPFRRKLDITLPNKSHFVLTSNFWGTEFEIQSSTGEALALTRSRGFFRRVWTAEIRYAAKSNHQLLWLVPMLRYYSLLRQHRSRHHGAAAG